MNTRRGGRGRGQATGQALSPTGGRQGMGKGGAQVNTAEVATLGGQALMPIVELSWQVQFLQGI